MSNSFECSFSMYDFWMQIGRTLADRYTKEQLSGAGLDVSQDLLSRAYDEQYSSQTTKPTSIKV